MIAITTHVVIQEDGKILLFNGGQEIGILRDTNIRDVAKLEGMDLPSVDYRSKEWLRYMHHDKKVSIREMARIAKVEKSTITRWMDKHGLYIRTHEEAVKAYWGRD